MPVIPPLLSRQANCMGHRNRHKHGSSAFVVFCRGFLGRPDINLAGYPCFTCQHWGEVLGVGLSSP